MGIMPFGSAASLPPLDAFSPKAAKQTLRPDTIFTRLASGEALSATWIGSPGFGQPEYRAMGGRLPATWAPPSGAVQVEPGSFAQLVTPPIWWRTWEGAGMIGAGAFVAVLLLPLLLDY